MWLDIGFKSGTECTSSQGVAHYYVEIKDFFKLVNDQLKFQNGAKLILNIVDHLEELLKELD